jgi:hypothetical protein
MVRVLDKVLNHRYFKYEEHKRFKCYPFEEGLQQFEKAKCISKGVGLGTVSVARG